MKEYKNLFFIYLSILLLFILFFLAAVHNSSVNNSMAEWVINYQGGFTRRGFLGEIVFQISQIFDFQLRKVFLVLQVLIYIGYFYSIYQLLKKINYNLIFAVAIFSPLFFIFSLAELEALGRKDILMFLVFVVNFLIFLKFRNVNYNYIYFIITFPIVFLTHEIYIIYIVYFLAFFVMIEKKLNLIFFIKFIFILFVISLFLNLVTTNEFSKENFDLLCKNLKEKSNESCGLAPYSMLHDIAAYQNEVGWKLPHVIRYTLIFLFGFLGLIISIFFSKINKTETNFITSKINLKFIFLLLALPSILPFLTAVDSGRYSSMAYTFPCIFYFGLLRSKLIIFDYEKANLLISNSFLKTKKYRVILLIILCFTWTPKAVYHEDISSFPLYRTIMKTPNFIGNFKNFNVNQL